MKADEMKIFRLEDRILFEAAAAAEIVEAVQNDSTSPEAEDKNQSEVNTAANAPVENSANYNKPAGETEYLSDVEVEINALIEGVKPQTTIDNDLEFVQKYDNESVISSDRELVVISSSVKDMSSILEQLSPTQEVLVLEQNNGLDELNTYLQEHENVYSAIHFISHGNAGEIVINGEIISNDNFEAAEWAEIGKSLTADGDILFYGCDIAQNEAGETLINRIAEVTNADVAASSDRTGFAGNWELEYINGNVTTQYLSVSAYTHTLADGQDIHYVSDYSELRDVLEDIADNGGDHTIKITQDIDFAGQDVISVSFNKAATVVIEADTVKTITGSDAQGVFEFWNTDQKVSITINQLIFQDAIPDIDDVDSVESAIYSSDIDLTLNNSTFQNFDGSAICAESWSRLHSLSVTYCNFLNNKSLEVGGAISAYAKNVTISNSYFYKNSAVDFGGAIELDASGKTIITNTSFWENYTDGAGGAINATTEGDSFTISNCTFYKNSAADFGGAIQFFASGTGEISISDTTFADNKLTDSNGQGSAIYNNGAILKIHNTLLIGEGKSVLYQNAEGESQLTYSLVTSCDKADGAKIEFGTGAFENTKYSVSEIFTTAEDEHHTIGINAFSEAAWGGATPVTDDAVDQRGVLRNSINTALGISGKYSIGAVTAQAAVQVVQENYSTGYTGNVITPENHTHLMYADGETEISKSITSVKLTSEPTPIIDVGTYDIAPSEAVIAGLASTVLVAYESGKLTVTPANLTITVKAEKVYDGSAAVGNSVFSFDITGDGASEFKTDWISVDSFTYHSKNVEGIQDAIGTISLAVAAKNFNIDSVEFLGEINAKNITVVAHDATKIYGDSDPELVYTATGLVGADTLDGSLVREAGENVGTYEITQGTLANANYIIDFTKGSFTITPKTITVVAHDATKIYGDSDPELVYTATGLVGADTLAGSLVREAGENVGTYEITQGTLANANYIIDFTKGNFTITPKTITVVAHDATKIYGDSDPELVYTATGLVGADTLAGSLVREAGENVGTYEITQGTLANANYIIDFTKGSFTITPKAITVVAHDATKIYGDSDPELVYTATGLVGADTLAGSLVREAGENVGTYEITQGTLANANYIIDFTKGSFTITPKTITVVAHDATKIYGDSDPELVYTATGLVGADTLAGSLVREAGENVGTYEITQGTLANANYIIDFTKGSFTITPKTITVVAHDATKIYGDSDPELVYTATGLVGADTLAGSLVREAGENVGTYEITQGTLANANYIIDFTKGSFTITPRDIMVSIDGSLFNKVFDGTVATEVADQNYSTNKLVDDEVFVSGYYFYDNAEAGTNKIVTLSDITLSGADAANYKLVNSVVSGNGAVITPKTVEVVFVTDAPYIYDGTDQSDTVSATYTDVNGNKVQLQINWNGQEFIKPGTYTVVAEFITADPNYQLKDAFAQVVMGGEIKTSAPIYSDGTNPEYSSVIPAIQGKILASDEGKLYYNNIYTMDYSELLATVAKQRDVVMESFYSIEGTDFENFSCLVSVDTLKYKPFELEVPVKEISDSVIGNSNVIAPEDFIRNQELNIEGKSKDNYRLLDEQGETLGGHYEDFYMDDYAEEFFELPEMAVTTFDKVENMKSELELLIDKLAKCV